MEQEAPEAPGQVPASVWKQRWVVHSAAVGSGQHALRYLSRYVFKTATGNRSLPLQPDGRLRWRYRDSTTHAWRHVDLEPFELLRRFLQHVLPRGFHRVRRFGWWHPGGRVKLNRVRALLQQAPVLSEAQRATWQPPPDTLAEPETTVATDGASRRSSAPGAAPCWCWWNAGARDSVRRGAARIVRLPEVMQHHPPGSTARACPAQNAQGTWTGGVCPWRAGRGVKALRTPSKVLRSPSCGAGEAVEACGQGALGPKRGWERGRRQARRRHFPQSRWADAPPNL